MTKKRDRRRKIDLREEVGQLLIMGFDGTEMSPRLRTMISTLQPGGVILFRRNIEQVQQTYDLVRECRLPLKTPGYACVDLEGGAVDRFRDVIAPAPSAAEVWATGNKKCFRKHGYILGQETRALGFNVDFAPVLDLGFEASRSVLTTRVVSDKPIETIMYARELLRGLADAGVLGCGKHFPGLGEGNLDSHHSMPVINKPKRLLWKEDLAPYRFLRRELPFVMVAHAAYPAMTKDKTPASVSHKWITGVLRQRMGYSGVIVSDDLEMGGVQQAMPIEEAAVQCIRAGAHMFLVCHKEELVWKAYEHVLTTAEKDRAFAALVVKAAKHVRILKNRHKEKMKIARTPSKELIDRVRRQLWEFSEEIRLESAAREQA